MGLSSASLRILVGCFMFTFFLLTVASTELKDVTSCNILIAGGSLSSLAAAITAANVSLHMAIANGATPPTVCYLEITDWPGGQLISSSVSAVDFDVNRNPADLPASLVNLLWNTSLINGNPGLCWVSTKCFQPQTIVNEWILPTLASFPNLVTYLNTAVTGAVQDSTTGLLTSVTAVQRKPVSGTTGWETLLSNQLDDWYSPDDSSLFTKTVYTFSNFNFVIEATEFGDVLMAAQILTAQGPETPYENSTKYQSYCGQGTTIPFYMSYAYEVQPQPDPWPAGDSEGLPYGTGNNTWARIWTYRRSLGLNSNDFDHYSQGEISNQNWGGGNDYDNGYLFNPLPTINKQHSNDYDNKDSGKLFTWSGGINITALQNAEQRAYGWYHYYKNISDSKVTPYLIMNATQTGTKFGLAKLPYLRDSRRSGMGLGGFRLMYHDLSTPNPSDNRTAIKFPDTIGIGSYFYADIHRMTYASCPYPEYLNHTSAPAPVLPYYIPYRALTVNSVPNLMVTGKAMSQSFWANAGTRLHPEEWVTGVAAGASAVLMLQKNYATTMDMYLNIGDLQTLLTSPLVNSPLDWTF